MHDGLSLRGLAFAITLHRVAVACMDQRASLIPGCKGSIPRTARLDRDFLRAAPGAPNCSRPDSIHVHAAPAIGLTLWPGAGLLCTR
jgi:hypothetical protein